ncbi:MAG: hypothetical protein ACM3JD_09670 [Rudaea sp.]
MDKLETELTTLENADLVRRLLGEELAYLFKHALTREAAYESLLLKRRQALHHSVGLAFEKLYSEHSEENTTLLAYHFERSEDWEKAIDYLQQAARWARRRVAHREEAELLGHAISIASRTGKNELVALLHAQRGRAFANLTQYADARPEFEAAIAGLPSEQAEERAEVLSDLAMVCTWLLDVPGTRHYANMGLALAEQLGRNDLAASAMGALAFTQSSDGLTRDSLKSFQRAAVRAGNVRSRPLAAGIETWAIVLYWVGNFTQAEEKSREAAQMAEELNDSAVYMRALGDLGLAWMGAGRYGEAIRAFTQVREFGKKHGLGTWTARAMAMQSGCHLLVFDFAGAEALAKEARDLARSANFIGPLVSAGIDLLFNYVRRQEVSLAMSLMPEVADAVARAKGSHGWLWRMRLAQVRAELALAHGNWEDAVKAASEVITQGRATGRVKYTVAGLGVRGRALAKLGRKSKGLTDVRLALKQARKLGDPAVFLQAAANSLALELDDALTAEARDVARQVAATLPTLRLREQFEATTSEMF